MIWNGKPAAFKVVLLAGTIVLVVLAQRWVMRGLLAELDCRRAVEVTEKIRRGEFRPTEETLAAALERLDNAVRVRPGRALFHYRRGQLLHVTAAESFARLSADGSMEAGDVASKSGELLRQAEESFARAAEVSPNVPRYQLALGWAMMDRFMFAERRFTHAEHVECAKPFERAVQLAPGDAEVNFQTGRYLLSASEMLDGSPSLLVEARRYFRRAAELDVRMLEKSLECLRRNGLGVDALLSVVPDTSIVQRGAP